MTPDRRADARLALAAWCAEMMYDAQGPKVLEPALDPRLARDWTLRCYITGADALFRPLGALAIGYQRVCYGFLLELVSAPGTFLAVVRGTAGLVEWIEDAEYKQSDTSFPGRVERGFVGIYRTLTARHPGGQDMPLAAALTSIVGQGSVTVVGHSLGSALATYLAYDLAEPARLGSRVSARLFASPRPGNGDFATAFGARVPDHRMWAYAPDLVPKVPFGFGYAHVPNTFTVDLAEGAVIVRDGLTSNHHAYCYAALLDGDILDMPVPDRERAYAACIQGRNPKVA